MCRLLTVFAVFMSVFLTQPVAAQRLLFEKDTFLFTATEDGKEARRLFEMPSGSRWAASPDGRRIAYWLQDAAKEDSARSLATRPVTVYVTDSTGRRIKRLFVTATLKDRQGRPISRIGVPEAHLPKSISNPGDVAKEIENFAGWIPYSLSWSADSRTLYFSCYRTLEVGGTVCATLSVDAAAGTALVDGEGRWKSITPLVDVEARGGLLVGAAAPALVPTEGERPTPVPLIVANLAEGSRTSLLSLPPNPANPAYAYAGQPDFSPSGAVIAFIGGTDGGVWVTDRSGKVFRQVAEGAARRPRWSSDSKRILFLLPRPGATSITGKTVYDLYSVPYSEAGTLPVAPTLILQGIPGSTSARVKPIRAGNGAMLDFQGREIVDKTGILQRVVVVSEHAMLFSTK